MNHPMIFTASDVANMVVWICGAICAVAAAAGVIAKVVERMKKPNQDQNARLDEHDKHLGAIDARFEEYDRSFGNDKKRIDAIEEGNRVTQQALLALLSHAINGNDMDALKTAESALRDYLVRR
jgi:hypothetical protein